MFIGIAIGASAPTFGGKVYKWVDDAGNVAYRDKPPPAGSEGKVEIKEIDSDRNVIQSHEPTKNTNSAKKPNSQQSKSKTKPGSSTEKKDDSNEDAIQLDIAAEEKHKLEEERRLREERRLEQSGANSKAAPTLGATPRPRKF